MNTTDTPRIYVACLAAYNNGKLHGDWIDVEGSGDDIREQIAAMLDDSPEPDAEEWAIHDSEGFGDVCIGEGEDLDGLAALAANIERHGLAFASYVAHVGAGYDDDSGFEDAYRGKYDSERDFAEQFAEDIGAIDDNASWPNNCIDWERATRELMHDYFSEDAEGGGVYIFRHC